MKNLLLTILTTTILTTFGHFSKLTITNLPQKKAQVMVLGSYHMNNPGQDVHNMEADDVLASKRQAEIQDLVAALAKFKPTKIAIERSVDAKSDSIEQQAFQQYLKGNKVLDRNEDEQVGFRLAKQLGHEKIYCIDDHTTGFPFNEMITYATEHNQLKALERGQKMGESMVKEMSGKLNKMTISEFLKDMNQPELLKKSHGYYMDFCKVGKGTDYPGADLVAEWYQRNIRIFSNINKITTNEEDRILVIFGAGHAPILRELIDYSFDYELVEAIDYL